MVDPFRRTGATLNICVVVFNYNLNSSSRSRLLGSLTLLNIIYLPSTFIRTRKPLKLKQTACKLFLNIWPLFDLNRVQIVKYPIWSKIFNSLRIRCQKQGFLFKKMTLTFKWPWKFTSSPKSLVQTDDPIVKNNFCQCQPGHFHSLIGVGVVQKILNGKVSQVALYVKGH